MGVERDRQLYKVLINKLRSKVLPKEHVHRLTVGHDFEDLAGSILDQIKSLRDRESVVFIRVIVGAFGSGKSHMLTHLYDHSLEYSAADENFLLSSIDLGRTARGSPRGFEFQIMKGLRSKKHDNYQAVFKEAYERIAKQYRIDHPGASTFEARNFAKNVVGAIVSGVVATSSLATGPGAVLGSAIGVEVFVNYLIRIIDSLMELITHRMNRGVPRVIDAGVDQQRIQFVDAFTQLVQTPQRNARFEELAKQLSDDGILSDVIFKILKEANFTTLVILADELEALQQEFQGNDLGRVLTPLREFHDALDNSGQKYPAIALIIAATDVFMENELQTYEPALYSRWSSNVVQLPVMGDAEIDALVRKLNHFYIEAGYDIDLMYKDDVVTIRNQINAELNSVTPRRPQPPARELIGWIVAIIEKDWVGKRGQSYNE